MTTIQHIIQHIGGKLQSTKQENIFVLILLMLFFLLLKGCIVYILYNTLVPKIIYSLSKDRSWNEIEENFNPLSLSESILLVILTNVLFNSF